MAIEVFTPFEGTSAFVEHFAARVEEGQIVLPYSEAIDEGIFLEFSLLLLDGSVALAGKGQVNACYDNGEEYPPEYRFDVVVQITELPGMNAILFERILETKERLEAGEPGTGEVDVRQLSSLSQEGPAQPDMVSRGSEEAVRSVGPEDFAGGASEEMPPFEPPPSEQFSEFSEFEGNEASPLAEGEGAALSEASEEMGYAAFGGSPSPLSSFQAEAMPPAPRPSAPPRPPSVAPVAPHSVSASAPPSAPPSFREAASERAPAQARLKFVPDLDPSGPLLRRPVTPFEWQPEPLPRPTPPPSSGLLSFSSLVRLELPPRPEDAERYRVAPANHPRL
ncbi:MAG: hypothetical protein NZM37_09110, partial [Sandaracinaceae bacterium]|nr:hypothetical protein [Sandaracinaceae bacterium]